MNKKNITTPYSLSPNAHPKGFTLVEVLAAVAVMGIIAAVGTGIAFNYFSRARDGKRKADFQNLKTALETYHKDNRQYPQGTCNDFANCPSLSSTLVPSYIKVLPIDPKNSGVYKYLYFGNEQSYIIQTTLESPVAIYRIESE